MIESTGSYIYHDEHGTSSKILEYKDPAIRIANELLELYAARDAYAACVSLLQSLYRLLGTTASTLTQFEDGRFNAKLICYRGQVINSINDPTVPAESISSMAREHRRPIMWVVGKKHQQDWLRFPYYTGVPIIDNDGEVVGTIIQGFYDASDLSERTILVSLILCQAFVQTLQSIEVMQEKQPGQNNKVGDKPELIPVVRDVAAPVIDHVPLNRMISLVLAEQSPLICKGIRSEIGAASDIFVVAEINNYEDAIKVIERTQPAVVLLDPQITDPDGKSLYWKIRSISPDSGILILSRQVNQTLLKATLTNGGHGFLLKDSMNPGLIPAIRTVASGGIVLGQGLELTEYRADGELKFSNLELTAREQQMVILVTRGMTNKEIADQLNLSINTVKGYVKEAMAKLGVRNRVELSIRIHQLGLE